MRGHISCKIIDRDIGNLVLDTLILWSVVSVQGIEFFTVPFSSLSPSLWSDFCPNMAQHSKPVAIHS
jgi:hypothetical protein